MLTTVGSALDALSGEVFALLTQPVVPSLAPQVTVQAARAGLAGLGGFVGVQASPRAEIHVRRIDAEVVVRVRAVDHSGLLAAEALAARDVGAADPAFLRRRGILRLERVTDAAPTTLAAEDGLGAPFARDLRFAVRFEHQPPSTAGEGVIGAVPQGVTLADGLTRAGGLRYATEMLTDPLGDFEVVTAGSTGTAGAWAHDAVAQEVVQTGTRRGGSDGLSPDKTGTWLVLRSTAAGGDLSDFVLHAEMRSDGPGGIGLVFGFRGPQDFAFALLEEPAGVRILGARAGGVGAFLAQGGQDPLRGLPTGQWLRLRLLVVAGRVELAVNEAPALVGTDRALASAPGRVGFFCRGGGTARFRHFRLSSL